LREALQGVARVGRFGILAAESSLLTAKSWLTNKLKQSTIECS